MRPLFFILFLLHINTGHAQKNAQAWIIKLSPSNLFSPRTPTLAAGIEWRTAAWGIYAEYGVKCALIQNQRNRTNFNHTYHKYKIEARVYLQKDINESVFFGLQYFAMPLQQQHRYYEYIHKNSNTIYMVESATEKRLVQCVVPKIGWAYPAAQSRFVFEWSSGIGVRFVSKQYYDEMNKTEIQELTPSKSPIGSNGYKYAGKRTTVHMEHNLRLGLRLGRFSKPNK